MDREAKTVFMKGLDEAIKGIGKLADELEETGWRWKGISEEEMKEAIKTAREKSIPELEEFKDTVLKMKECQ